MCVCVGVGVGVGMWGWGRVGGGVDMCRCMGVGVGVCGYIYPLNNHENHSHIQHPMCCCSFHYVHL